MGPLSSHIEGYIRRSKFGLPPSPRLEANPGVDALLWLIRLARAEHLSLAVDVECMRRYALLPKWARLRAVGLGIDYENGIGFSWSWPIPKSIWREIKRVLRDPDISKTFCNGFSYDGPILERYDAIIRGRREDIRDGRRALVGTSRVGLGPQASYYRQCGPWKADAATLDEDDEKGTLDASRIPKAQILAYNAEDCVRTAQIRTQHAYEFTAEDPPDSHRRLRLYRQHCRTARVASWMHLAGFPVDERERRRLSDRLVRLAWGRHALVTRLTKKRGHIRFGAGGVNEEDLRSLIFKEAKRKGIRSFNLEVPMTKVSRTETGKPSVSKDALLYLFAIPDTPDELKEIIRACWKADAPLKARSTYVDSRLVLDSIGPDHRLHAGHNSCGTETGRWSCRKPNLYNLSEETKDEEGSLRGDLPNIRSMYVAPKGFVIVHGDWKQLELEVMADVTGDHSLQRMLATGDCHTARVHEWFNLPKDAPVPKMLRRQGKVVGFAAQYSAGVGTVFLKVLEQIQDASF